MKPAYPLALYKDRLRRWPLLLSLLSGHLILLFGILMVGVRTEFQLWQWIGFAIYATFIFYVTGVSIKVESSVSIVPHFSKPLQWKKATYNGRSVARYSRSLDEIAKQEGVATMSSFGFTLFPLAGKITHWHSPLEAIASIRAIVFSLRRDQPGWDNTDVLISELENMLSALELAKDLEIEFCLALCRG